MSGLSEFAIAGERVELGLIFYLYHVEQPRPICWYHIQVVLFFFSILLVWMMMVMVMTWTMVMVMVMPSGLIILSNLFSQPGLNAPRSPIIVGGPVTCVNPCCFVIRLANLGFVDLLNLFNVGVLVAQIVAVFVVELVVSRLGHPNDTFLAVTAQLLCLLLV